MVFKYTQPAPTTVEKSFASHLERAIKPECICFGVSLAKCAQDWWFRAADEQFRRERHFRLGSPRDIIGSGHVDVWHERAEDGDVWLCCFLSFALEICFTLLIGYTDTDLGNIRTRTLPPCLSEHANVLKCSLHPARCWTPYCETLIFCLQRDCAL
jgi:hypothetical protein